MASDVDISSYVEKFESFYTDALREKINRLLTDYPMQKSLLVDFEDLEKYDRELADILIRQPDSLINAAELALVQSQEVVFKNAHPDVAFEPHVRFFNLPDSGLLIQDISSRNIRELISVKGVVTKRGPILHKVKVAVYKCQMCDATTKVPMTKNAQVPQVCSECKRRALKLEEEDSYFVDVQKAEAQELLERLTGGAPAATITLWMEDDLVNKVTPGDTIEITGVMRLIPPAKPRTGAGSGETTQIYTRYIDVVNAKKTQKDFEEIETTKEDEARIRELATDPKIYEKMYASVAQGIYGHSEVKEALTLQLFGGTKDKFIPGGAPIRNDIHILLIGDPGSAKTRFLQYVKDLAPKGIFVSGKSVTGVGLTASAEKDDLGDGGWTLKAGALVIASGGIASVDEFDKIDEGERAAMHEVMESQTVSVAKAGIVAQFKAKTSILAAANPKFGRFDPNQLPGKQFDIPPTILSRFDLIFPIIDVMDETKDAALADFMLQTHRAGAETGVKAKEDPNVLSKSFMRKYISYARQHFRPRLTDAAMKKIKDFYVELRRMGKAEGAVPITPRQIEGLVRLSEASAKLRLSETVDESDAERAIHLTQYVLEKVSRDRETGKLDIDIIATGKPKSQTDKINTIMGIALRIQTQLGAIEVVRLVGQATDEGVADEMTVRRIVDDLIYRGELYKVKPGFVKIVNQVG
ncbi:MAG: minichromosome maintenance protein MCM [Candidatus Micrarchaeia archaeon]|jgi:replicative DNA helicase Mcm